jgi:hypothetical protein
VAIIIVATTQTQKGPISSRVTQLAEYTRLTRSASSSLFGDAFEGVVGAKKQQVLSSAPHSYDIAYVRTVVIHPDLHALHLFVVRVIFLGVRVGPKLPLGH